MTPHSRGSASDRNGQRNNVREMAWHQVFPERMWRVEPAEDLPKRLRATIRKHKLRSFSKTQRIGRTSAPICRKTRVIREPHVCPVPEGRTAEADPKLAFRFRCLRPLSPVRVAVDVSCGVTAAFEG